MFDDKFMVFADKSAQPINLNDAGQWAGAAYQITNTGTSTIRLGGSSVSGGPTIKGWPLYPGVTMTFNVNVNDVVYAAAEDPATARLDLLVQDN